MGNGISPTKGHNPRFPVLRDVLTYEETMGVILNAVAFRHKYHGEAIKKSLKHLESCLYVSHREALRLLNPGKESLLEEKIRFNDSVSRIRTLHNKNLKRIREMKFGEKNV